MRFVIADEGAPRLDTLPREHAEADRPLRRAGLVPLPVGKAQSETHKRLGPLLCPAAWLS